MAEVFAFACWHKDRLSIDTTTINAPTRSKALREYFLDVRECWPDVKWTDLRARKVGGPVASSMFLHVAKMRGLPDLRPGDRVATRYGDGVIVDAGSGANFLTLFDSGRFAGQRLAVHPHEFTAIQRAGDREADSL